MKILKEKKLRESPGTTTVELNTDHEGLAKDMIAIIKRACSSARLGESRGMYYVELDPQELQNQFLRSFDFSRAETKHGF